VSVSGVFSIVLSVPDMDRNISMTIKKEMQSVETKKPGPTKPPTPLHPLTQHLSTPTPSPTSNTQSPPPQGPTSSSYSKVHSSPSHSSANCIIRMILWTSELMEQSRSNRVTRTAVLRRPIAIGTTSIPERIGSDTRWLSIQSRRFATSCQCCSGACRGR
jgi:hypothetical protein